MKYFSFSQLVNHRFAIALTLIVVLGAFLRLYNIETKMRFIWDEGRDMRAVRTMIVTRHPTLFGPFNEMGGKKDFFGVFHYYLMAPALLLANFDPLGPAILTAILGVVTIGMVYWFFVLNGRSRSGIVVAALYAVSPLMVRQSQWPWNPNTIPFFSMAFFLACSFLRRKQRLHWSLCAGLLLGLCFQLHYFTLAIGIWWVMSLWYWPSWKKKALHFFVFIMSFMLPNMSFVLFDLTHEFFYFKILRASFTSGTAQSSFLFSPLAMVSGLLSYTHEVITSLTFSNSSVGVALTTAFFIGGLYAVLQAKKKQELTLEAAGFLLWLFFYCEVSFFPSLRNDYHSLGVVWVFFCVWWWLLQEVIRTKPVQYLVVAMMLIGMLLANNVFRTPTWSENMPKVRAIGKIIAEDQDERPFNIAALTDADTKGIRYRYFIERYGRIPLNIDTYPEVPVLYVITPHGPEKIPFGQLWEVNAFASASARVIGKVDEISIVKLENSR